MYVSMYSEEGFSINLATASLATGELDVLVERAGDAKAVGNHLFFSRGDSLYKAMFDPETHQLLDAGEPVMQGLNAIYGAHASFDISDNGTLVYKPGGVQGAARRIMRNPGDGLQPTSIPDAPYDNGLALSGDGSRICVTRLRPDGMWEIWGGTFDPPRMRRILAAKDSDYCYPRLSYDGSMLVAAQIETTSAGVEMSAVAAPVDGSRPPKVLWNVAEQGEFFFTSISADNKRVLGSTSDPNAVSPRSRLVELDIETGEMTEFLSRVGGVWEGYWSPDGKLVSFVTGETGVPELYVYNPETKEEALVSDFPSRAHRWLERADGSLGLQFMDDQFQGWEASVGLGDAGQLVIGEIVSLPYVVPEAPIAYAFDNRGNVFTIEPGEEDRAPGHLVVIENWLDTVLPDTQ